MTHVASDLDDCILYYTYVYVYIQAANDYGIDWDGPISADDGVETVTVPDLPVLTDRQRQRLREELSHHNDYMYGVENYVLTRHFICECHSA